MRVLSLRRRGSGGNLASSGVRAQQYIWVLFIAAVVVALLYVSQHGIAPSTNQRLGESSLLPRSLLHGTTPSGKRGDMGERFATLFHSDLVQHFKFTEGPTIRMEDTLISTLQELESVGVTTVIFSSPWDWFEAKEGTIRFDYLDAVAGSACKNTHLKVAFILDLVRAPAWVFTRWPDAKARDSHDREYPLLSWFHGPANQKALESLVEAVTHLVSAHHSCVTSVQPVYNNQYEARYTQEHDCYQDYSPPAVSAFRQWLQAQRPQLESLNLRWGTSYGSWNDVVPLTLEAGAVSGVDATARYWDFIKFRESYGSKVLNAACAAVQSSGARCFHHIPDFFTVLDAVYGNTMFPHIAASENTDFIIIDSNFFASYGGAVSPNKLRLNIAAAMSYNKPVYFEAVVERAPALETLEEGFRAALLSGAKGVGLTNWFKRYPLDDELRAVMNPVLTPCRVKERLGLFLHLDSCAAFHGLQWGWSRKDPIQDFVQDLAETLASHCEIAVSVHLDLTRFYTSLPEFDRVIFVEPLVLLSEEELNVYSLTKAYISTIPHELMHLPINRTQDVQMTVLAAL